MNQKIEIIKRYDESKNNFEKEPMSLTTLATWAKDEFGCKQPSLASLSPILKEHRANLLLLNDAAKNEKGKQRKRTLRAFDDTKVKL